MGKTLDFVSGGGIVLSSDGSTANNWKLTIGVNLTDENLPADTSKFFIGELQYQLVIRPGFVWANGQVLTDVTASYPKLKAWLKDTGPYGGAFLRKTLDEWNTEWNDTKWNAPDTEGTRPGMSPFYVLDESEDTIKVPDLRGAYQAAAGFDGQESGMTLADATRQIRGGFGELGNTGATDNGAIVVDSISGIPNLTFTSGTSNLAWIWRRVDSSRVVPVAKTNRPRSIVSYLCLYAGAPV